jgi:urease accessory protein
MVSTEAQLFKLLHLADSALPVGAIAHSFGLETLAQEGALSVQSVERFLNDSLQEIGALEGGFCRQSHRLVAHADSNDFTTMWLQLNRRLSALRPARESRAANHTLAQRLLRLVQELEPHPLLHRALCAAKENNQEIHFCCAFGLAGATLQLGERATVLAYLRQNSAGIISACQRLLPLGQSHAGAIVWRSQLALQAALDAAENVDRDSAFAFSPLLDLGSMRHPSLTVRLFIS